jgi:hypothetical protein
VGYGRADERWLHLPGVATFNFDSTGVEALAREDIAAHRIRDAHRRLVLPLALQAFGQEVLHASAVSFGNRAVAFCGTSGTGKSTVAYALARRGHPPCADDAVAVNLARGGPEIIPLPFSLRLRPPSAAYYQDDARPTEVRHPTSSRRLAAICVLRRSAGGEPELRRLGRAEAFPAVLEHAYSFGQTDELRSRRMMEHYLTLVSDVPVLEMRLVSGLPRLDGAIDELEAVVG